MITYKWCIDTWFQLRAVEKRRERIQELLEQQEKLKAELLEAKGRLMINRDTWSYDCKSLNFH